MLLNSLFLIISTLLATTNAQCPQFWWPMGYFSVSANFFTEVMKNDSASQMDMSPALADCSIFGITDRVGVVGNRAIGFSSAGLQNMQVNPDFYFCGAFTMTLWINPAANGVVLDFKDLTLDNGYQFGIATAGQMSLISRSAGVSVTNVGSATALSIGTLATPVWNFAVITFSGITGDLPSKYASTTFQPSGPQFLAVSKMLKNL